MAAVKNKAELIDRYVYAVTGKLPVGQRDEIELDIRGLIEDMLEERALGEEANMAIVEDVLSELGHPGKLTAQYRETKRYLIGPELFDMYWVVMKIVALWSLVGIMIAYVVQIFIDSSNMLELFVDFIGMSLFSVIVHVFAWVTVIFAIMEYAGLKTADIGRKKKGPWHPSELPSIPDMGTPIRLSSTVASMMFLILFFVLFVHSNLFGIHLHVGSSAYTFISFWNYDVVQQWLPYFYVLLALYILREIIKLVIGQWTKKLLLCMLTVDVVTFIIYVFLFADQSIWNPNFMSEMLAASAVVQDLIASTDSYTTVSRIWEIIRESMLFIIAIAMIIEHAVNFYRVSRRRPSTKNVVAG